MSGDIKTRVRKVLSGSLLRDIDTQNLGGDTPLLDYGVGVDSVSRLEFLVALEEEFGIRLDEAEITPDFFDTVDSISDYIAKRVP
jgi:acyl carrier protein